MDNGKQTMKHSLRLTILWILLILVAAAGSTYAWFTLSGRASTNVTPMGGSVSRGETSLLISQSRSGPFDRTCELIFEGSPDALRPVSTADLERFYKVRAATPEGIAALYSPADDRVNSDTLHGTVYLQCLNAPCDVYFDRESLNFGGDAQALAAMRLGMKITSASGTVIYFFSLDDLGGSGGVQSRRTIPRSSAVVASISETGEAFYTADPSEAIGSYMAGGSDGDYIAGAKRLVSLQADEIAAVEYWLYLEGCDEQCINQVQNRPSGLRLAFAGVDAGE